MQTYVILFTITFIIGIITGMGYEPPMSLKLVSYSIFGITLLMALVLMAIKKLKTAVVVLFLISGFFLGMGRYISFSDISDPNHIIHFLDESRKGETAIIGAIIKEPVGKKTAGGFRKDILVRVLKVQLAPKENSEWIPVSRGNILVKARDTLSEFNDFEYADLIKIRGNMMQPPPAQNPGGFDYRSFLFHQDTYSIVSVKDDFRIERIKEKNKDFVERLKKENKKEILDMIENLKAKKLYDPEKTSFSMYQQDKETRDIIKRVEEERKVLKAYPDTIPGYPQLAAIAYKVKQNILLTIKKTVPFPESAFLGGVTLGLRAGLSSEVQEEFRSCGVAHVLAVSGLHVGFIGILFLAIAGLIRLPMKVSAPLIVFALILFSILTGAAPSTVRASMMFGLAVMVKAYLKGKWSSSVLFALSVSGLIYLLLKPLMLPEAGFVMSFSAILSLAVISTPLADYFNTKMNGLPFITFMLIYGVIYPLIILKSTNMIRFFYNPWILVGTVVAIVVVYKLSMYYKNKFYRLTFGFASLPSFFTQFAGAQFGVNIGNVLPISATYFGRISLSGVYANWIAIPLIGVIVQLGFIAGIFGVFSTKLALVLNAANFLFCKFFLAMTHFFAEYFEYPKVPQPPMWGLVLYYGFVVLLLFQGSLKAKLQTLYFNLQRLWEYED